MIPFIDLKAQYDLLGDEIKKTIDDVFKKGNFILGENVAEFEKEFSSYCGLRFGIGVSSGTDALRLALIACGIKEGDEVITVANTAIPTAMAISTINAIAAFADIDPATYTIDPAKIEEKITPGTKAIIPVHLYGQMADMDKIREIARNHNLWVIEDACQAHGAEYKGKKAGSLGHVGCFSFYPTKNLGAYGDGGMIVTNDEALREKLLLLRNYGQKDKTHSLIKGYNSRLDELQAAFLRVKLKKLDRWNQARRVNADMYKELLTGCNIILPQEAGYARHVYHLFTIRHKKRDSLMQFLRTKGVETLIHYPVPIHLQKAYSNCGLREGDLPVTESCANEILSLPIYPELTEAEVQKIAAHIGYFVEGKE
jgi:dTDP-4-amino-4,6-dideoxygalactose transaminase